MGVDTNFIGQTGLEISQLGFGAASIGGMSNAVPLDEARAAIETSVKRGVTHFDTAPFYGHGLSERLIGDGLRNVENFVLSSKVGRILTPGAPLDSGGWVNPFPFTPAFDYSYDGIMRSYEDSLQRLGLDHIDILYLHDIGNYTHGETDGPGMFETAMNGGYKALDELRSSGAISAIGIGVNEAAVCEAALDRGEWDLFMLAGRYTLLEQDSALSLLAKCTVHGTDIVIAGPFNSGVLVGGDSYNYEAVPRDIADKVRKIQRVCESHNVDMASAALQFPLAHAAVKSTLPGPRTPVEVTQIHNWWNQSIPTSLWSDLKQEGLLHLDADVAEE